MIDAGAYSNPPVQTVDSELQRLDELVRLTTGLAVRETDLDRLAHWATDRVRVIARSEAGPGDIESYGRLLAEDNASGRREREILTVQFTTGESYFFRDQGQFDLLAAKILPELIERRANERSLRIWSAGCAAGEEPYSIAMLVDEMAPRLAGWNVLILGTDISTRELEKAHRGEYGEWSFRTLDKERRQRYFHQRGKQWCIDVRLRDMVSFRGVDLVRDRFPDAGAGLKDFDLILCRNVFIYLDPQVVGRITAQFARALADGGYLITGHNELFGHDTAPLRVRMFPQSAAFQKTERPAVDADLGHTLEKERAAISEALRPVISIAPQTPCVVQRAVPAIPAVAPAEDCDQLMQAAWRHADRGRPDAATEVCRKAIAIAGLDPRPYYLLAQLAQERGDAIQAKTLLTKVIYLDPSCIAAYLELGALHAQAGDSDRARRMYETARATVSKLPAKAAVAPYSESSAADILAYVERLLGAPAGEAAAAAALAPLHQSA